MNTSHELSNTEKSKSTANRVLALARKTSAEIVVLATLATGLGVCGSETTGKEEAPSSEEQITQIISDYNTNPEEHPLREGTEITEVDIEKGDSSIIAANRELNRRIESGEFPADDWQHAYNIIHATSENAENSREGQYGKVILQPGDHLDLIIGDIDGDGKHEVAIAGSKPGDTN